MSENGTRKPPVAQTLVGLPEVPADPATTQLGLEQVPTSPGLTAPTAVELAPVPAPAEAATREGATMPGVPMPAPPPRRPSRLAVPAAEPPADAPPPRRPSRVAVPVAEAPTNPRATEPAPPPRRQSKLAVPVAEPTTDEQPALPPRRLSREAVPLSETTEQPTNPRAPAPDAQPTNPRIAAPEQAPARRPSRVETPALSYDEAAPTDPKRAAAEPFEWTMPRVAAIAGGGALLLVVAWLVVPALFSSPKPTSAAAARPKLPEPPPPELRPAPPPRPPPAAVEPTAPPPSDRPVLALDSRAHVVDPFGLHAPDLPLDSAHKYRLRLERDDAKLGRVLVRLDEGKGWGVVHKLASHAALQFGGAQQLRIHCEPGKDFADTATFPLELVDLATKKRVEFQIFPARHCWDLEVMRTLELGEGVRRRVRVPVETKVKLGENVPLKVAYVVEALEPPRTYRAGVLTPGESVLVEGRRATFALFDPYAGDNEGRLELELHDPDTAADGLAEPAQKSGVRYVPLSGGQVTP